METLVIKTKNKAASALVKKLVQELEGIESISLLSKSEKEDLAMINAIIKGRSGKYVATYCYLQKLKG